MKCLVCRHAVTLPGAATVTLEHHGATFVFNDVPAHVCPDCGEDYVDEVVAGALLRAADDMATAGTRAGVRSYASIIKR